MSIVVSNFSFAQGWIKRQNAPKGLEYATATSVLGKGYLTGGYGSALYEYDPNTFKWTQKATMPGATRICAVGVNINNKLYAGLGFCHNYPNYSYPGHNQLYEYDPTTNIWVQKASSPASPKWVTGYFAVNNKLYVTLGHCLLGACATNFSTETWQYDPATDTWTQKASFPGGGKNKPTSFAINNMGYIVGGGNTTTVNELWQYNPNTDTWTKKANCPVLDDAGVAFVTGSYAYCLTSDLMGPMKFLRYDPASDTWTQLSNYPGPNRVNGAAFSIGNLGFVTTGLTTSPAQTLGDLWEYNPNCPANIINDLQITNQKNPYCADTLTIDSVKAYAVQHSGVSYNWLSSADSINYTIIPNNYTANILNQEFIQTTWLKRTAYLNAQCLDTSTPLKVAISHYIHPKIDTLTNTTVCKGDTVVLKCDNPYSKYWFFNGSSFDTATIVKVYNTGFYQVNVMNYNGCDEISDSLRVDVHSLPQPTITVIGDTIKSDSVWASYQWLKNDTVIAGAVLAFLLPVGTGSYSVEVIDSNGCKGSSGKIHFTPSSIDSWPALEGVEIFPNPAKEAITITNNSGKTVEATVYDVYGRIKKRLVLAKGVNVVDPESDGITTGIYTIVLTQDNQLHYSKLIVQ